MGGTRFDVVVVGAGCAGSALAARLAAQGVSVALIEAARVPSGRRTSTHLIQPPGMDELDALGIGNSVRRLTPALRAIRLSYDGREARLPYGAGRAAHCLRRETLDPLLQDAAVRAGADLRARTRVVELVRDSDGRARGVDLRWRGGGERLHADLVVGADGRHSSVAKLVGAEEYLGYDGPRACYWAYWRRPREWDPHELHNIFAGDDTYAVFPADDDLLLIATAPPVERARSWRGDHVDAYLSSVRAGEGIGSALGRAEPVSEVRGVLRNRYFFRRATGPGWALIGDAGHHKEFVAGLGISDALGDARDVSRAIVAGEPLAGWWRRRDAQRIEIFSWSRDLGRAHTVNALERLTAVGLAATPELQPRFGRIIDGELSPYDLVPTRAALLWVGASVARGDPRPLAPLLSTTGRRLRASWNRCRMPTGGPKTARAGRRRTSGSCRRAPGRLRAT